MDIKLDNKNGKFKFRVCGILEHNGKYLTVKIMNNKFFCLPGGHVELGEDTEYAVQREMKEELGFDVEIKRLIAINQNFFKIDDGRSYHEIGFYYIVNARNQADINPNDYEREELDKGQLKHLEFRWYTIDELKNVDFRPAFLRDCLNSTETTINITRDGNI